MFSGITPGNIRPQQLNPGQLHPLAVSVPSRAEEQAKVLADLQAMLKEYIAPYIKYYSNDKHIQKLEVPPELVNNSQFNKIPPIKPNKVAYAALLIEDLNKWADHTARLLQAQGFDAAKTKRSIEAGMRKDAYVHYMATTASILPKVLSKLLFNVCGAFNSVADKYTPAAGPQREALLQTFTEALSNFIDSAYRDYVYDMALPKSDRFYSKPGENELHGAIRAALANIDPKPLRDFFWAERLGNVGNDATGIVGVIASSIALACGLTEQEAKNIASAVTAVGEATAGSAVYSETGRRYDGKQFGSGALGALGRQDPLPLLRQALEPMVSSSNFGKVAGAAARVAISPFSFFLPQGFVQRGVGGPPPIGNPLFPRAWHGIVNLPTGAGSALAGAGGAFTGAVGALTQQGLGFDGASNLWRAFVNGIPVGVLKWGGGTVGPLFMLTAQSVGRQAGNHGVTGWKMLNGELSPHSWRASRWNSSPR